MSGTILLVLPVPFMRMDGILYVERQAANGLNLWAQNFEYVLIAAPIKSGIPEEGLWVPLGDLKRRGQISVTVLPWSYRLSDFVRNYKSVREKLRGLINQADYLQFAISGLIGDWALIACLVAQRMHLKYAVWTDAVSWLLTKNASQHQHPMRRIKYLLTWYPMRCYHINAIRRSALGLFHGMDTYHAYSTYCSNPHLVHNIHLHDNDLIPPKEISEKLSSLKVGPIRICYVGRAHAIKGPLDWVTVLRNLDEQGIDFSAMWLGDGELLEEMRTHIMSWGLADRVSLPGQVEDNDALLKSMRQSDIFMFCHKEPESPRCLIEALMSGCPIVGYESHYCRDLVKQCQGGLFCDVDDIDGLTSLVIDLSSDRQKLSDLVMAAAQDGMAFSDEKVFKHRSDLIKKIGKVGITPMEAKIL